MNTLNRLLPMLASAKPSGADGLFGPIAELLNAMVAFVWWTIWAKGFACGFAAVVIPLVTCLACTTVYILATRKRTDSP